jgi:hypothetical protein
MGERDEGDVIGSQQSRNGKARASQPDAKSSSRPNPTSCKLAMSLIKLLPLVCFLCLGSIRFSSVRYRFQAGPSFSVFRPLEAIERDRDVPRAV